MHKKHYGNHAHIYTFDREQNQNPEQSVSKNLPFKLIRSVQSM